jgi:type IV pilus assembly protein PilC
MSATMTFDYRTIGPGGKHLKGKIDASNEAAAAQLLRQQGMVPLSLTRSGTGIRKEITIPGLTGRTSLKDLALFARQFATMISSGMSLLRALAILEDQAAKATLKTAVGEVRADLERGVSLSDAMARHERIFPTIMIAMIRAGETGGFLDRALERIATNLEKDAVLRSKIKGAMTYPVIVLMFSLVMITAVLVFIVPVFEAMFIQLGGELPLPTKIIVTLSNSLVWGGPLTIGLVSAAVFVFRRQLKARPGLRLAFDRFKLRLPVFGPLLAKVAIGRFTRNLGTLLSSGVPVMQALSVVGATTGNAVVSNALADVADGVRDGQPMSVPMQANQVFPKMVTQMVEVGEESGQISAMLDKIADYYDREIASAAESMTASIEPIMVVFMGIIVGSMVICLYLPMFTIYENIGAE